MKTSSSIKITKNQLGCYFFGSLFFLLTFGFVGIVYANFMARAFSSKDTGPETDLITINKGQSAIWLETGKFSDSLEPLGVKVPEQTEEYSYSIETTEMAAYAHAMPRKLDLKRYVSATILVPSSTSPAELTAISILCEEKEPGKTPLPKPVLIDSVLTCQESTIPSY
ncbi:MAG: type IV pilin-like G/H family protein [Lyngbya sp.]|nr:type IV pilin-like G/H family protein [Lyngbya sp.]